MPKSMETILTYDTQENLAQWSEVWSTSDIPLMDRGAGMRHNKVSGRRILRLGTLAFGALLTMHCKVIAGCYTGGTFIFLIMLAISIAGLANPFRHFEVYLGQWSISGPGRAFRITPMLDGIGIAVCLNAIFRAICCCAIAAITLVYISVSVSDEKLPFKYCRNFDLQPYHPIRKEINMAKYRLTQLDSITEVYDAQLNLYRRFVVRPKKRYIRMCNESFTSIYPPVYKTSPQNYFYVEVMRLKPDYRFGELNVPLMIAISVVWGVLWVMLVWERIKYGRMVYNIMNPCYIVIPCLWAGLIALAGVRSLISLKKSVFKLLHFEFKDLISSMSDALELSLYIHSASTGSELIHGKGLNHYANGHIDSRLHGENVWHSALLFLITCMQSVSTSLCGHAAFNQEEKNYYKFRTSLHLAFISPHGKWQKMMQIKYLIISRSTLIYLGLSFSYMMAGYKFTKTALHTIFEYRVKLVFAELYVAGALMAACMVLSYSFATSGGLPLLESVDTMTTGITTPLVCLLELVGLMYVYRGHDFTSDINIATEDNTCGSRIHTQFQIIPVVAVIALILKIIVLTETEVPRRYVLYALSPVAAVVLAVPVRAAFNTYKFVKISGKG